MIANKLAIILCITKDSRAYTQEVIDILNSNQIEVAEASLVKTKNLIYMLSQLFVLSDGLKFKDNINIHELAQNHYEFLDALKTIIEQLQENIADESLVILKEKINKLIDKLNEPLFLQSYNIPIRRFFTGFSIRRQLYRTEIGVLFKVRVEHYCQS